MRKLGTLVFVNFSEEMVLWQVGPSNGEVIWLTFTKNRSHLFSFSINNYG